MALPRDVIIAIDGYSSCGKSTFARAIARRYQLIYIDTGAMYRAVTLFALRN
ncbi:MAG TPA: (d)CMP kinase, partial [Bacteroidales bacterium]|nr:(d)CMP kinase [Bacteroidales bacterium]